MVKIRMFMPYLNMKSRFEEAVKRVPEYDDIEVEVIHVFGTPESLSRYGDAEILVARGMTYDRLKALFPEKHVVELQLSSFDILEALLRARKEFNPSRIALCVRYMDRGAVAELESLCQVTIRYYEIHDETSTLEAIYKAREWGADVYVGAGTMCGLCDKEGLNRVHIHTKDSAIDQAMRQALDAARTINIERARSKMTSTILNSSSDAVIAINAEGRILALNNQAYRTFQLSPQSDVEGRSVDKVCSAFKWREVVETGQERAEVIQWKEQKLYTEYKPVLVDKMGKGAILIVRYMEQIMEAETKIRQSLAKQGLTAKYSFDDIIGTSQAIRENILIAKRYSRVDSNVLIIGETGTGKELFAHSIHRESRRSPEPFVALNCAALPENLLESELFGYEAGAFSGASKNGKAGLFELAHKGTIFLDEIGEIPITLQAKLLRVLQEREIRRIGSNRVQPVDVRVISATNINMEEKIQEGQFRADLYYRLNLLDIVIPPLRERSGDIREMVDYYLTRFACEMGKPIPRLSAQAVELLTSYNWPGNVRELRNICERLIVLCDSTDIEVGDIRMLKIFRNLDSRPVFSGRQHKASAQEPDNLYASLKPRKKKQDIARELGVSRTTLWRLEKLAKQERQEKDKE
ncbi:MAG: sigma 54-interacting transcriptional regulator [Clostridium sp.]|nr:sigma 54-interacting transcriptional regulator [Clostridium sp.]